MGMVTFFYWQAMKKHLGREIVVCSALLVGVSGCNSEEGLCVGAQRPGLSVAVSDSRTKRDLTERTMVTATALRGRDGYQVRGYGNEALQTTYGSTLWSVRLELEGYRSRTDTVKTSLSLDCVFTAPTRLRVELEPEN
jgi:hypothetical protein